MQNTTISENSLSVSNRKVVRKVWQSKARMRVCEVRMNIEHCSRDTRGEDFKSLINLFAVAIQDKFDSI